MTTPSSVTVRINRRPTRRQWSAAGYTIVEMMVSITIGLFLVGGLITLIVTNSVNSTELNKTGAQIENGRYALQLLMEDIQHAGYWGTYASSPTIAQAIPANLCDSTVAGQGFGTTPPTTPVALYGIDGSGAVPASCTTKLTNWKAGTDIVVVRRVSTTPTAKASAVANEIYMQVSNCSGATTPFVVDTNIANFTLKKSNCTTDSELRKYMVRIYFVRTCSICGTDTTPTLAVAELTVSGGGLDFVTTPLVEGIENLQVDYGLDTDLADVNQTGAGAPDCYVTDPSSVPVAERAACLGYAVGPPTTALTLANWQNVVAARVNVLARNVEPTAGWVDNRVYNMGMSGPVGPANDAYKRHLYTAVARLYNAAGMREAP